MKMKDDKAKEMDYSRDVVNDLVALSFCRNWEYSSNDCGNCPYIKFKPEKSDCNPYDTCLIDALKEILLQLPGERAEHFVAVIDKCYYCAEFPCDPCPFFEESVEVNMQTLFQHIYDFLRDEGLYNEDGSVSEKGRKIRISDTLALLKTTELAKDSWTEERGGLL